MHDDMKGNVYFPMIEDSVNHLNPNTLKQMTESYSHVVSHVKPLLFSVLPINGHTHSEITEDK